MSFNTDSLESMCELIIDCPHSTPEWTDSGVVVLRNQNIKNGNLDLTSPSYTTQKDYEGRIKRAEPTEGDIVLTREAPMGEVCRIPKGLKCCLGQRQVLLRPKKEVDGEYLFWALQSPYVQNQIAWSEGTGSTVSNLRIPLIKSLKIPRFHSSENDIGKMLSGLWKKIELNTQTNQTLESIAQAIFKSWFVDFDPVKAKIAAKERWCAMQPTSESASPVCYADEAALPDLQTYTNLAAMYAISGKNETELAQLQQLNYDQYQQLAETAALFPSAMVDSELGEIPEGWGGGCIGDIASARGGFAFKSNEFQDVGNKVIKIKNITGDGRVDLADCDCVAAPQPEKLSKFKISNGDLLMAMTGATVGKIGIAVSGDECVYLNQRVAKFESKIKTQKISWFLFPCIEQKSIFDVIVGSAQGSAQPNISSGDIERTEIVVPSEKLIVEYCEFVDPMFRKWMTNNIQNIELSQLRDSLLPKLLSGEIDLTNIQSEVA